MVTARCRRRQFSCRGVHHHAPERRGGGRAGIPGRAGPWRRQDGTGSFLEPGERDPAAGSVPASATEPRGEAIGAETAAAGVGRSGKPGQSKGLGADAVDAGSTAKAGKPADPGESARSEGAGGAGGADVSAGTASSGTSLISTDAERQATVAVGAGRNGAASGPAATASDSGPVASKEVGRPGKALLAAAAIAGVLLVSVPFLIAVGDDSRPGASEAPGTVLGGGGTDAPGTFSAASPDARQGGGPKAGGATAPGSGAEASGRGPDEVGLTAEGTRRRTRRRAGPARRGRLPPPPPLRTSRLHPGIPAPRPRRRRRRQPLPSSTRGSSDTVVPPRPVAATSRSITSATAQRAGTPARPEPGRVTGATAVTLRSPCPVPRPRTGRAG